MERKTLTWPQRGQLWLRLGIRLLLTILTVLAAAKLLRPSLSLFAPFLLAYGMAAVLNPLVRKIQRKLGWSRGLVSLVTVLVLVGLAGSALGLLIYGLGSEVVSLAQNWEGLFDHGVAAFEEMEGLFDRFLTLIPPEITLATQSIGDKLVIWVQETMSDMLAVSAEYLTNKAIKVPGFLLGLVMFLMGTYFLTADYPYLR